MIKKLRSRFIRITMLSVTAVMLLLTVILNTANYISTDSDLKQTLTLIYENAGTIPMSALPHRGMRTHRHRPMMPPTPIFRPTVRTIRRRRRPRPMTRSHGTRDRSPWKRRFPLVFSSCATQTAVS